jgi:hypothetical protein
MTSKFSEAVATQSTGHELTTNSYLVGIIILSEGLTTSHISQKLPDKIIWFLVAHRSGAMHNPQWIKLLRLPYIPGLITSLTFNRTTVVRIGSRDCSPLNCLTKVAYSYEHIANNGTWYPHLSLKTSKRYLLNHVCFKMLWLGATLRDHCCAHIPNYTRNWKICGGLIKGPQSFFRQLTKDEQPSW